MNIDEAGIEEREIAIRNQSFHVGVPATSYT